jgi:hypothetical protein
VLLRGATEQLRPQIIAAIARCYTPKPGTQVRVRRIAPCKRDVLPARCRRYAGKPAIIEVPAGHDLTQWVLEIAEAVIGVADDDATQQVHTRP